MGKYQDLELLELRVRSKELGNTTILDYKGITQPKSPKKSVKIGRKWLTETTKDVICTNISTNMAFCRQKKQCFMCPAGHEVTILQSCTNRLCPRCEKHRKSRALKRFANGLLEKNLRFMTVTRSGHRELNYENIKSTTRYGLNLIRRFRRSNHVKEYIMALELVSKGSLYYYHLHIIYSGKYISKSHLSDEWFSVTNDSYIVDIQRIRSRWKAINYVVKYITKPIDYNIPIRDYVDSLYKTRLITRSMGLEYEKHPLEHGLDCPHCDHPFIKLRWVETQDINGLPLH